MCTEYDNTLATLITNINNNQDIEYNGKDNKELILGIIQAEIKQQNHQIIQKCAMSPELSKAIFQKISNQCITDVEYPHDFKSDFDWTKYTIRHYTKMDPSTFGGIVKSNLALTVDNLLKPTTKSLNQSGHTTSSDWSTIGNVGDTFYALFYEGASATGITPTFITDATYYIEWTLDNFKECWASPDYLGDTKSTIIPSYSGNIKDVILASLLQNNRFKSWLSRLNMPSEQLKNYKNFEIKKHGSMKFNDYYEKRGNEWVNIRWDDDESIED